MNICVIEDHPILQLALNVLIRSAAPEADVIFSNNFSDGLKKFDLTKFDLLILDIDIPEGENIRMMQRVKEKQPDVIILIHSAFDEEIYALPYITAGADGYLSKNAHPDEFQQAFKTVMNKQKYISKAIQYALLNNLDGGNLKKAQNPLQTLSQKEIIVMQYIIEGKWTKEIALMMDIKENTVSTYKRRIFDKLEVSDELELVKKVSLLKNF